MASMSVTMILVFGILFAFLAAAAYYFNIGIYGAVVMASAIGIIQWAIGPKIIRMTTNMKPLDREKFSWIEQTVHELCIKNRVKIPQITIANTAMPNAFVFGRTSSSATLTQGLIN